MWVYHVLGAVTRSRCVDNEGVGVGAWGVRCVRAVRPWRQPLFSAAPAPRDRPLCAPTHSVPLSQLLAEAILQHKVMFSLLRPLTRVDNDSNSLAHNSLACAQTSWVSVKHIAGSSTEWASVLRLATATNPMLEPLLAVRLCICPGVSRGVWGVSCHRRDT